MNKVTKPIPHTIPLEEMERLEKKYNIHLHIEQYGDLNIPDRYYQVLEPNILLTNNYLFLGHTIETVKKVLAKKFGY